MAKNKAVDSFAKQQMDKAQDKKPKRAMKKAVAKYKPGGR